MKRIARLIGSIPGVLITLSTAVACGDPVDDFRSIPKELRLELRV
jgi:hypothetical protein